MQNLHLMNLNALMVKKNGNETQNMRHEIS